MRKNTETTKYLKLILVTFIIIEAIVLVLNQKQVSLDQIAGEIVSDCKQEKNVSDCYDKKIPKLMDKITMEEAFQVTQQIQGQDESYAYCHVLGHELAGIETSKNPDSWKQVIARCPRGSCSNGCVHGAFQERFRNEILDQKSLDQLQEELISACEDSEDFSPTGIEKASCYHALGHLLMYVTDADIARSVESCDQLTEDKEHLTKMCYHGSFMQIFQPLGEEDKDLVSDFNVDSTSLAQFCEGFNDDGKTSCWTEGWPLFFDQIVTPDGMIEFCSHLEGSGKEDCIKDILYVLPIQFRFNLDAMTNYCLNLPDPYPTQCFRVTAERLLEIDIGNIQETIEYCDSVKPYDTQGSCYEMLSENASFYFNKDSESFTQLCLSLPLDWQNQCLNGSDEEQN